MNSFSHEDFVDAVHHVLGLHLDINSPDFEAYRKRTVLALLDRPDDARRVLDFIDKKQASYDLLRTAHAEISSSTPSVTGFTMHVDPTASIMDLDFPAAVEVVTGREPSGSHYRLATTFVKAMVLNHVATTRTRKIRHLPLSSKMDARLIRLDDPDAQNLAERVAKIFDSSVQEARSSQSRLFLRRMGLEMPSSHRAERSGSEN